MSFRQILCSVLLLSLSLLVAGQETCSLTKSCSSGCCSAKTNETVGTCGFGPEYCGKSCIAQCDRKSQCDPGWGMQWSTLEHCPLNVCCSQWGWCGSTGVDCDGKPPPSPSCNGSSTSKRAIGYYESWNIWQKCDAMQPEQIPLNHYTHINFAFVSINPTTYHVQPFDQSDVSLYKRTTALKQRQPDLQVWISLGGWTFTNPDQPTAHTFSELAANETAQGVFFESLAAFLEVYGFDGIDIDWEYPGAPERSGRQEDYTNFVTLVRNLREYFTAHGQEYGISICLPPSFYYMQNYDIANLVKHIDWFNLMSYYGPGAFSDNQGVFAHTNLTETEKSLDLLWRNNIDPDKVSLGLGFSGLSYNLESTNCRRAGCPYTSVGPPGPCTNTGGSLSFTEIERIIANNHTNMTLDASAGVQLVTYSDDLGDHLMTYDDEESFKLKADWANARCLGGFMVWAIDMDDGTAIGRLRNASGMA